MSAYFLDLLQGLTTLKALGRSREQVEIVKKVSENYRQTTMSVLRVTFLSAFRSS
jgi:ATP-binding cassette subfamily C protein CydD